MKNYTTPIFKPILLGIGNGTDSGCAIRSTSARYVCPVYDIDINKTIFSAEGGCNLKSQEDQENVCYGVPLVDYNVYNS